MTVISLLAQKQLADGRALIRKTSFRPVVFPSHELRRSITRDARERHDLRRKWGAGVEISDVVRVDRVRAGE